MKAKSDLELQLIKWMQLRQNEIKKLNTNLAAAKLPSLRL